MMQQQGKDERDKEVRSKNCAPFTRDKYYKSS